MSLIDKAKELSGHAIEKAGDLGGDDLIVNAIIRGVAKQKRLNELLKEQGCEYRISEFAVENNIPPKISFSVTQGSE